jgi:thiol-disulfide isomerase/thioredoxin
MARMAFAAGLLAASLWTHGASQPTAPPKPFTIIELHPTAQDLAIVLRREVAAAIESGRKPFAELVAKWCGPCRALDASLTDPAMVDAFRGTAIFKLDIDEWHARLGAVGLPDDQPVPGFYRLDNTGRATSVKIDGEAWGADIPKNMAPPLKAFFSRN